MSIDNPRHAAKIVKDVGRTTLRTESGLSRKDLDELQAARATLNKFWRQIHTKLPFGRRGDNQNVCAAIYELLIEPVLEAGK